MSVMWRVSYKGFLQEVVRWFATKQLAEQWARKVGVYGIAKIKKVGSHASA